MKELLSLYCLSVVFSVYLSLSLLSLWSLRLSCRRKLNAIRALSRASTDLTAAPPSIIRRSPPIKAPAAGKRKSRSAHAIVPTASSASTPLFSCRRYGLYWQCCPAAGSSYSLLDCFVAGVAGMNNTTKVKPPCALVRSPRRVSWRRRGNCKGDHVLAGRRRHSLFLLNLNHA